MTTILHLVNMWPTPDRPAAGTFVKEQVDALRERRPDWSMEVLRVEGHRSRLEYLRGMRRVRARAREGVDLVHAHYGLTGAVARAQWDAPLVVTFHGSDINIGWQRAVSRVVAATADRSIFVAERLRARLGVPGEVIPCGVDTDRFAPRDRRAARAELSLPLDRHLVLFPADPERRVKNYPLFRAALERLPPALRSRTDELVFSGIPRKWVPLYMNAADVMLLTSNTEGAPVVVREALLSNLPVVAVDAGDVAEVLEGVRHCHVVERDAGALARAVAGVLEAGDRADGREVLLRRGDDRAGVADRIIAVYESVLAGRS